MMCLLYQVLPLVTSVPFGLALDIYIERHSTLYKDDECRFLVILPLRRAERERGKEKRRYIRASYICTGTYCVLGKTCLRQSLRTLAPNKEPLNELRTSMLHVHRESLRGIGPTVWRKTIQEFYRLQIFQEGAYCTITLRDICRLPVE